MLGRNLNGKIGKCLKLKRRFRLRPKMSKEIFIVRCANEECFNDTSESLKCGSCNEGKLILKCWNCKKEHEIEFTFRRIDCDCGASFIPCEINKYNLEISP